jgi:hypothetical protein
MWRLCKLGYRHEPGMLLASFFLALAAALPDALLALWFKLLAEGVLEGNRSLVVAAAIALGVSVAGTWFLRTVSTRVQRRFRDKVTIALESHVARLQASVPTIAHQERPEFLDRLSVLRNQVFVLDHMYMSVFSTCGWILRLGVIVALLVSIHPALVLLAVFALPTVLTSTWRPAVERSVQERGAPFNRLARHLFTTATTATPGKEVRVTGIGSRLATECRAAWERWYGPVSTARWATAEWHALAWAIFGGAFVGAVVFVSSGLRAPAGDAFGACLYVQAHAVLVGKGLSQVLVDFVEGQVSKSHGGLASRVGIATDFAGTPADLAGVQLQLLRQLLIDVQRVNEEHVRRLDVGLRRPAAGPGHRLGLRQGRRARLSAEGQGRRPGGPAAQGDRPGAAACAAGLPRRSAGSH